MRRRKRLLAGTGIVFGIMAAAVAAMFAMLQLGVRALPDGAQLGDGSVTTVVAGSFGPIAIGAYVFKLADGGVGLVDAGIEPDASAIRASLTRMGKGPMDVRAIFLTHGHNDHARGAFAFPAAALYVMQPDASVVESLRGRGGARLVVTKGLHDADRLEIGGTPVEVFGLPGHTPGSAAIFVHGVLFLGDGAASLSDGTLQPNTITSDDGNRATESLRELAARLKSRRAEIRHIAFGHQGALDGLDPLLTWASATQH